MVRWACATIALVALAAGCELPHLTYADETRTADASLDGSGADGAEAAEPLMDAALPTSEGEELAESGDGRAGARDSAFDGAGPSCTNRVLDGDETSVDCGGSDCPRCRAGSACDADSDCISAFCHRGSCAQATCIDHIKNLKETDVDCGGGDCHPCNVGATCSVAQDCAIEKCVDGKCQPPSCDDGVGTSGETDVDCGGASCAACPAGKHCLVARDCDSQVCSADGSCAAATCFDAATNGGETDLNCGGPACPKCADGAKCATGADCTSAVCAITCQPASCNDQVTNGAETDVDCGGGCPAACATDERCALDADCASGNCVGVCAPCPRDMVAITPAAPAHPYCIDATEVTVAAYAKFLLAPPKPASVPATCADHASYAPGAPLDLARPTYPVTHVDWCDAATFCAELGRHLCGRIGARLPLLSAEEADPSKSEWFNACGGPRGTKFPYGDTFVPELCAGTGRAPPNGLWTAGGNTCEGGVSGLFDMSGNVAEWEDNCAGATGAKDTCDVRGGSYQEAGDDGSPLACASVRSVRRSTSDDPAIGFRCCL